MIKKYRLVIWLVVVAFLTVIKLHNYDRVPGTGHAEELLFSWSGIYLIETGVPQSWSTLDYPDDYLVFDGIVGDKDGVYLPAKLYRPWLDEPPLYSLVSGGVSHLFGDDRTMVSPTAHIRIPSVLVSLVTMVLVFGVARRLFGFKVGMLSMICYGLIPTFVFGSRLSVPENMTAMVSMLAVWLMLDYQDEPKLKIMVWLGFLSSLLGLMKPTGLFLVALMMFFAVKKRRWGDLLVLIVFGLSTVGLILAWGARFDWVTFGSILKIQGQRFPGWTSLVHILVSPAYDIFEFFDGWYVFSMLSTIFMSIALAGKDKKINLLALFFFFWLMVAVFSGTEQDLLPWYRYPLFPLMSIFAGLGIVWLYRNLNFYTLVIALGLFLSSRFYLSNAFRPLQSAWGFRLVFLVALVPSLLAMGKLIKIRTAEKINRSIFGLIVFVGLFLNSRYIYSAIDIMCENQRCAFGPQTVLSRVKFPVIDKILFLPKVKDGFDNTRPFF